MYGMMGFAANVSGKCKDTSCNTMLIRRNPSGSCLIDSYDQILTRAIKTRLIAQAYVLLSASAASQSNFCRHTVETRLQLISYSKQNLVDCGYSSCSILEVREFEKLPTFRWIKSYAESKTKDFQFVWHIIEKFYIGTGNSQYPFSILICVSYTNTLAT